MSREADLPAQDLTYDVLTRESADKNGVIERRGSGAALRVEYGKFDAAKPFAGGILAVVRYGTRLPSRYELPFCVDVQLDPLLGAGHTEVWRAHGPVKIGHDGRIRYAYDDHYLFADLTCDEREFPGIEGAAESLYCEIQRFQRTVAFPHLLRIWNYLDAVNQGGGDLERYRQFCTGRARGFGEVGSGRYPAASAVGRPNITNKLQICWLAGRSAALPIENPRQISAYHYPRMHGPTSPSFSRAAINTDGTLIVSGTASIVGHISRHSGDVIAQIDETLINLKVLCAHAAEQGSHFNDAAPNNGVFKVYVRDPAQARIIAQRLRASLPGNGMIFLNADICRRELLLEIEGLI